MPARLSDIARALRKNGIAVEEPSKGSHWKARGPDGKMYPLPAHNAGKSQISDVYIKKLCEAFGLDEAKFRALL